MSALEKNERLVRVGHGPSLWRHERRHCAGGFNWSMQHTRRHCGGRSVADEAKTEDLLHGKSESCDVGALAERGVPSADRPVVRSKPLINTTHSGGDGWDTSGA